MSRASHIVDQLLESSAKDMVLDMHDARAAFDELERLGWGVTKSDLAWNAQKKIPFARGKPVVIVDIGTKPVQNGIKQMASLQFYQDGGWAGLVKGQLIKGQLINIYPTPFSVMAAPKIAEQVEAGIRSRAWSPSTSHYGNAMIANIMDILDGIKFTR